MSASFPNSWEPYGSSQQQDALRWRFSATGPSSQLPASQLPSSQLPSSQQPCSQLLSSQLPSSQQPPSQHPDDHPILKGWRSARASVAAPASISKSRTHTPTLTATPTLTPRNLTQSRNNSLSFAEAHDRSEREHRAVLRNQALHNEFRRLSNALDRHAKTAVSERKKMADVDAALTEDVSALHGSVATIRDELRRETARLRDEIVQLTRRLTDTPPPGIPDLDGLAEKIRDSVLPSMAAKIETSGEKMEVRFYRRVDARLQTVERTVKELGRENETERLVMVERLSGLLPNMDEVIREAVTAEMTKLKQHLPDNIDKIMRDAVKSEVVKVCGGGVEMKQANEELMGEREDGGLETVIEGVGQYNSSWKSRSEVGTRAEKQVGQDESRAMESGCVGLSGERSGLKRRGSARRGKMICDEGMFNETVGNEYSGAGVCETMGRDGAGGGGSMMTRGMARERRVRRRDGQTIGRGGKRSGKRGRRG